MQEGPQDAGLLHFYVVLYVAVLSLAENLRFGALFFFSMYDAEFGPWLILQALHANLIITLFAVTESTVRYSFKCQVDATKFQNLTIANRAGDLLRDKRGSKISLVREILFRDV
jgi:hypothetical protein